MARRRLLDQLAEIAIDQSGIDVAPAEALMAGEHCEKSEIGDGADHMAVFERLSELAERRGARRAVGDHLGDHRVVEGRDRIARAHAAVNAHIVTGKVQERRACRSPAESLWRRLRHRAWPRTPSRRSTRSSWA